VDEGLTSIEEILRRESRHLDSTLARRIRDKLGAIRLEMKSIKDTFGLKAAPRNAGAEVAAIASYLWVILEDVRPSKLIRYGSVSPDLFEMLDPPLVKLSELALEIEALAKQKGYFN